MQSPHLFRTLIVNRSPRRLKNTKPLTAMANFGIYSVQAFDSERGISTEYDNYAFFHSSQYKEIENEQMNQREDNENDFFSYVKLQVKGRKPIYLKYHSWHVCKRHVMLSYKNRCLLGMGKPNSLRKVLVTKTCWFKYYWYNNDSGVKCPFRISVVGLAITVISTFATFTKDYIEFIINNL